MNSRLEHIKNLIKVTGTLKPKIVTEKNGTWYIKKE